MTPHQQRSLVALHALTDNAVRTGFGRLPAHIGVGDPISDAIAAMDSKLSSVVLGVNARIDQRSAEAKAAAIAEIDKQGGEAKMTALLGGFAAGLFGVAVGYGIARATR